jgi:hypothetical protein
MPNRKNPGVAFRLRCGRQNRLRLSPVSLDGLLEEVVMVLARTSGGALALAAISIAAGALGADAAFAAQGPGTGAGTASGLTQTAMAILVYGASALIVGAGPDRRAEEVKTANRAARHSACAG